MRPVSADVLVGACTTYHRHLHRSAPCCEVVESRQMANSPLLTTPHHHWLYSVHSLNSALFYFSIVLLSVIVKDLRLKDKGLKIGPRVSSTTSSILEDKNTAVRQYGEIDMNSLTGAQWQSHPFVTQSLQDDDAWYFTCYVSLLNPRKSCRTLTSEDNDKDKDLKIGPRGSSRTRNFLKDNNAGFAVYSYALYCHCVWQWWLIKVLFTYLFCMYGTCNRQSA